MFDKAMIHGKVWMRQEFHEMNVYINDNQIVKLSSELFPAKETIDVNGDLILPGLIDPHVHFDLDLGFIRSRDDFISGSRQAAFGGISTYIDFLDPVDNPEDLEKAYLKRKAEVKGSYVDYFFHATIKNPQCDLELFVQKMLSLNIRSLKLFTTYSDSNRRTYDKDIIELLKLSEKYHFLLLAHIENDDLIHVDSYDTYYDLLTSRPSVSETKESLKLAGYVEEYGGYLYMVHLSSGETIKKLMNEYPHLINQRFYIESCPHYFVFSNENVISDDGYLLTLAPPLRTRSEQKLLKKHIQDIYTIGTDHCAFNKEDKMNRPLMKTPIGIGGIEYSFDMMYHLFGEQVIDKMSKNIAKLYPCLDRYGEIEEGYFANLIVYHLEDNIISESHGQTNYSLYINLKRKGYLVHHLLKGQWVIKNQKLLNPIGKEI
jgi:dihydropyrimidinase